MTSAENKAYRFLLLLVFSFLFRLLPFRVPNVEPIMASLMPLGGAFGAFTSFIFGISSVLLYDIVTGTLGVHTFFVAGAFGVLGIFSGMYFKSQKEGNMGNISNYIRFAVVGTLFFDAVTGLMPGPIFYGQSFAAALSGQIPFTALHLLGNVAFAATLSPVIHYLLIKKRKPDPALSESLVLNPKII